jgi:hypothetical protein
MLEITIKDNPCLAITPIEKIFSINDYFSLITNPNLYPRLPKIFQRHFLNMSVIEDKNLKGSEWKLACKDKVYYSSGTMDKTYPLIDN